MYLLSLLHVLLGVIKRNICILKEHRRVGEVTLSCPTLCDPMDCNPPGSSIRGIF